MGSGDGGGWRREEKESGGVSEGVDGGREGEGDEEKGYGVDEESRGSYKACLNYTNPDLSSLIHQVIKIKDIIWPPEKDEFNDVYIAYELMDTDLRQIIRSSQELTDDRCQVLLFNLLSWILRINCFKFFVFFFMHKGDNLLYFDILNFSIPFVDCNFPFL
ncbi:hypothetical protein ACSBR1_019306 [Camellia fascicularis]